MNQNRLSGISPPTLSLRFILIMTTFLVMLPGQGSAFTDVTSDHWAYDDIGTLASTSITSGCDSENYCPDNTLQRSEMAIFLLRAMYGSDYAPPTGTGTVFEDVSSSYWAGSYVEKFADLGITSGCDASNYCPSREITRAEMAIFLVRAKYGTDYVPSAATGTVYGDISSDYWAGAYIETLANDGYLDGTIEPGRECEGEGYFCPSLTINRAEMAVFLVQTFELGASDDTDDNISDGSEASLVGSWTLGTPGVADGVTVLTFMDDSHFMLVQDGDSIDDPSGQDGMEVGTYGWEESSGVLTVNVITDTNGEWGLSHLTGTASISVSGDTLTLSVAGADGTSSGSRITDDSNTLVGGWLMGTAGEADNATFLLFLDETNVIHVQDGDSVDDPSGQDGMEVGTYTWNETSGLLSPNILTDTNGEWGLSHLTGAATLTVSGDTATLSVEGADGTGTATRITP
ncbi:MAG: S-layer homology domain-containing protein [Magnetococcales bacterium]|nr:S-layer homology domain-containing protein [Magnetococcales bacterium]